MLLRNVPYKSWTEDESGGVGLRSFDQRSPPVHFKFGSSIFFSFKGPFVPPDKYEIIDQFIQLTVDYLAQSLCSQVNSGELRG